MGTRNRQLLRWIAVTFAAAATAVPAAQAAGVSPDDRTLYRGTELDAQGAEAFLAAWSTRGGDGIRCLKHWVSDDAIALLVEAPNEASVRARDPGATEVTELFAPAQRWASCDSIDFAR